MPTLDFKKKPEEKLSSLTLNHSVIVFHLLSTCLKRDLELVKGLEKKVNKRESEVKRRLLTKSNQQTFQLIDSLIATDQQPKAFANTSHCSQRCHPTNYEVRNVRRRLMNQKEGNV